MLELLTIGTWLFWAYLGVVTIAVLYGLENEKMGVCSVMTVIGLVVFGKSILALAPWQYLLIGFLAYLAFGAVWSIAKWFKFTRAEVARFNAGELRPDYSYNTEKERLEWLGKHLQASKHKEELYLWITFWPWSVLWTFTADAIKSIYEALLGVYGNISKGALRGAKASQ